MSFLRKHVHRPGHPLAPPSGTVLTSRIVLYDKLGAGSHPCHWCGRLLHWAKTARRGRGPGQRIIADHLDKNPENDEPTNLVPACNGCNISRGHHDMAPGDPFLVISGVRHKAVRRQCETCQGEFLMPISQTKYRTGRFCSRACRNTRCVAQSESGIKAGETVAVETCGGGKIKRVRGVSLVCGWCENPFVAPTRFKDTRSFCSGSCAARFREAGKASGKYAAEHGPPSSTGATDSAQND